MPLQKRPLLMLAVALVMGSLAVLLVNNLMRPHTTPSRVLSLRTVPVVVAAHDIQPGIKLDPLMLKTVDWPADALPQGAFSSADAVVDPLPPVALREIRKGEIVLAYKLSGQGARGGLASRIPEDQRAISIPVSEISGVSGFVMPGSYVDVLHTSAAGRADQIPATKVLLQNVPVIGIGQNSAENKTDPKLVKAVTLLVDPESGQKVALALATGSLSLLLRNEFDASLLATQEITWRQLGPSSQAPVELRVVKRERRVPAGLRPAAAPATAAHEIEMIRGLKVTQQTVVDTPTTTASTQGARAAP
ncbi:MAG: pilus assembly protein CpaB [Moraxellaceae bacterium]|jgi:pilus assembly protein CpaB|nr:pilus assembly protein CpaB [Moraxellaceae bacterium]